MSLSTPFINPEANSFEVSSDYAMAVTLCAKGSKNLVSLNDVLGLFKFFGNNYPLNIEILQKFIRNANYFDLLCSEVLLIRDFLSYLKKDCIKPYFNPEIFLHTMSFYVENNLELLKIAYSVDLIYLRNNQKSHSCFETTIMLIFKENENFSFYAYAKRFNSSISSIHKDYYDDIISDYLLDNDLIDILGLLEIDKIGDLFKYSNDVIYILFSRNIVEYIDFFNKLSKRKKDSIVELTRIINMMKQIVFKKDSEYNIFCKRYGILCDTHTLEEIGNCYNITRERIRQIEKKSVDLIKTKYKTILIKKLNDALLLQKINVDYLEFETVRNFIDDDEITYLIRAFIKIIDDGIAFDENYNIFYYKNKINSIIEKKALFLPFFIQINEVEKFNNFEQTIITKSTYYRKIKNRGFLKSKILIRDLYSNTIDETYPNGFRMDDSFLTNLNNLMIEKYSLSPISLRALSGIISRCNYCLIDSGTLLSRKFSVKLDEELESDILDYIFNLDLDIVYYITIFTLFKEKLVEIGINNRFYLKGVLDPLLPKEYKSQKDYISIGEKFKTATNALNDVISSFDGLIALDDIKNKFPGVADYVFTNHLNKRNDVLNCGNEQQYIKIKNEDFSIEFINTIKNEILFLFDYLKSSIITSTKIYSRMNLYHVELMEKIPLIKNHFAFYSLLTKLFKKDFYFRRPYISNDKSIDLSIESIISNYTDSLDYFNSNIISSFCTKTHLRYLCSYLDFTIEKSDKFILIDKNNCIKKEKIVITDTQLNKIKQELDFHINSFGLINTQKELNYNFFPNIGYKWSKYLLIGIIRCYLDNFYIIEYTDSSYTNTEFIIRRI